MSLQSTDQVADLITRIRNAVMVGKTEIRVPTSKLKQAIVEILVKKPLRNIAHLTQEQTLMLRQKNFFRFLMMSQK